MILFWLDSKLVDFFVWLHRLQHKPRCTPVEAGISHRCSRCPQQWISEPRKDIGVMIWVEVDNGTG